MWISIAAICGAFAVVAGAFGAHGLKTRLAAEQLSSWSTASQYHLLHSVVLLVLALFSLQSGREIRIQGSLFLAGTLLFSGSIYLLLLTDQKWLGPVTPVGGLLLIAGWLSLLGLARD
jgi:uncharacterized membrane protein YgdD (TMEM256/DUF423 family)